MKLPSFIPLVFLSMVAIQLLSPVGACSVMEMNRVGSYLVEESIRTTSDPTKLVALLGEYDQNDDDHWNTRDPVSVQKVTIDVTTGKVFLGEPESVTVNDPLQSTQETRNYTVEVDSDGTSAVLSGPDLTKPFPFAYSRPAEQSRLEDVFFYSDNLDRGYFFHNSGAGIEPSSGEPVPSLSAGGGPSRTQPVVAVFDLSSPDHVSYTIYQHTERPNYFNGPARNHWDSIQVVEMRENGADCFQSAYFYYNETDVRLVGYRQYTRNSFNLNAITFEDDGAFAYNIINIVPMHHLGMGREETPESYKIVKTNIATGEKTEIPLQNVMNPLPMSLEAIPDASASAGAAWNHAPVAWIASAAVFLLNFGRKP